MTEVCGNSKCEGNEPTTCASDCAATGAVCGNGQCESTESNATCPGDCTSGGGGGQCPTDPTVCILCLLDMSLCPSGMTQATCQACALGGGGGTGCSGGAPNGVCDAGETMQTCPFDCPV